MTHTHNQILEQDLGRPFEAVHLERESLPSITKTDTDFVKPVWEFEYVRTLKQLEKLCKKLSKQALISVDTETSGTESTEVQSGHKVMTDLSLHLEVVQVGIPKVTKTKDGFKIPDVDPTKIEGTTYLVDARAIKADAAKKSRESGKEINPMAAFREPFENESPIKAIQHRAFEDGQFERKYSVPINGVIDTEKLAKTFRPNSVDSNPLGPLMVSYSLGALSLEILDRHLDKDSQKGPWNLRNGKGYLPEKLEDYARLDAEETIYVLAALLQFQHYVDAEIAGLRKTNDTQGLLKEYRTTLLERERLYEESPVMDAAFFLEASAQAYENNLKSVVLPLLYKEIEEKLEAEGEDPGSASLEHKTVYGSAYRRKQAIYKLDWDKLTEIDPSLASELRPEPSVTKKAIEQAITQLDLGETHSANKIWEEIRKVTGNRTAPSLKIALEQPVPERSVKPFMKQVVIPEDWGVDDHLQAIIEARVNKLKLLREDGVANQLGLIEMKLEGLREALLESLQKEAKDDELASKSKKPNTSWKSEGEVGKVSFSTSARDERDVEKLMEKYPEIARLAIERDKQPAKTTVIDALRERGYEPEQVEELASRVFETVGYGRVETLLYPKYGLYYKGPDEEFLDFDGNLKSDTE